jgi:NRAMP (natural resistance-associated macrophage protein)-like metal ion transporter
MNKVQLASAKRSVHLNPNGSGYSRLLKASVFIAKHSVDLCEENLSTAADKPIGAQMSQNEGLSSPEPPPLRTDSVAGNGDVAPRVQPASPKPASSFGKFFKLLGPGLVAGAADDDPSGIATYSQVGAQFGYALLWTMPFIYPFMASIQEISAQLGRVSGRGIAGNIKLLYPRWILYGIVTLLLFANIVNLGADIGAMGAAVNLMVGGPTFVYCLLFTTVTVGLEIFVPYKAYSSLLKWLTLSLFAYVGTIFVVQIDWGQALRGTFVPNLSFKREYLGALVAVLGTTISPYLFFWQSAEEVEQMDSAPKEEPLKWVLHRAFNELRRIKADTFIGMAFSNLIAYFIILTVAVTLNAHGKTDIANAAQAAEALRPLAGTFASLLFSLGVVGTGLLAVPVLAGSAAYGVGEAFGWPVGLERKAKEAKAFYAVLAVATLIGLGLNFSRIDPMRALVWSAIINGVTAPPVMVFVMLMASKQSVMGKLTLPIHLKILGWAATLIMALAAIGLFLAGGS